MLCLYTRYQSFCVYAVESLTQLSTLTLRSPHPNQNSAKEMDKTLTRILNTRSLRHLSLQGSITTPEGWNKVRLSSQCKLEILQLSVWQGSTISPEETTEIITKVDGTLKHLHLNVFTYPKLGFAPSRLQTLYLGPSMNLDNIRRILDHFSMVPTLRKIEIIRYRDARRNLSSILCTIQDPSQSQGFRGLKEIQVTVVPPAKDTPFELIEAQWDPNNRRRGAANIGLLVETLYNKPR